MATKGRQTGGESNRDADEDGTRSSAAYSSFRDRPLDAAWSARRSLAVAAREMLNQLIGVEMTESEICDTTLDFERRARELAARPHMSLQQAFDRLGRGGSDEALADVAWRLDYGPNLGLCNPSSAPIRTWERDGGTGGTVTFGARYEGPPGWVNGGYVAAALDEVSGLSAARSGMHAMTARLTISYRKPTPLERELTLSGEIVHVEGRKIQTVARIQDGDELLAEAEGLFIALRTEPADGG